MARTILAIESSTDWLSVALLSDEDVIAFEEHEESRQHASALLPAIDALLSRTGIGLGDLDAIGLATGPGSFTSLRIGLATVKGLTLGRDIEAIGVSTLEAMALSWLERDEGGIRADSSEVFALLDARRDEWYAGGWKQAVRPGELLDETLPEGLYSAARLIECCDSGIPILTPDARGWRRMCEDAGARPGPVIEGKSARPRADSVGRVASRRLLLGQATTVPDLEARYVRRAEAEAKRLGEAVEAGEIAQLDPQ